MSAHLNPEDFIAAIDEALPPAQRAHLDACASCRASLADARDALQAVEPGGDVPEPSPLFWEQLSARIHEATREVERSRRGSWWMSAWKPLTAGCAAAALLWAVGVRPGNRAALPVSSEATIETSAAPAATWDDVVNRVNALTADEISTVAEAASGTSLLVDDLTPAERDAFARLLEQELGQLQ